MDHDTRDRTHKQPAHDGPRDHTEKDLVCGMDVDPASALRTEHGGRTYFFCNPRCQEKFRTEPSKYLTPQP